MRKRKVYIAGPLFSYAEQCFNINLAASLKKKLPHINFILPQKHAKRIAKKSNFTKNMFWYCINSIQRADLLLCLLDGPDVDSGTAIEMGYAYACKKPIIGFRSDFRSSEDQGMNLMVSHVCSVLLWMPSNQKNSDKYISTLVLAIRRILKIAK